jgi:hypothetical protein
MLARAYGSFDLYIEGIGYLTGANTLDVARISLNYGLLNDNTSTVAEAYRRVHNEVVIEDGVGADGIRRDGSFGQHIGCEFIDWSSEWARLIATTSNL